MKSITWNNGIKESKYFATTRIANDNGNMASKLNSMVQQRKIEFLPAQCVNSNTLKIYGTIIGGDYDFYIYANSQAEINNSKIIIQKCYDILVFK